MNKTIDKINYATDLYMKWMSYKWIANLLLCSPSLVHYYVKKGLAAREKDEPQVKELPYRKVTRIVNLCPHSIWIKWKQYNSEWVVRVEKVKSQIKDIVEGVPTYKTLYRRMDLEIPPRKEWVVYVVSTITAWGYTDREDIYTISTENPSPWVDIDWLIFNPYYK